MLAAARGIAAEFDLPADWMNQRAQEGPDLVVVPPESGKAVLVTPSIVFEVPSAERMLGTRDLVLAALHGDDLTARQFVKDAAREGFSWTTAPIGHPNADFYTDVPMIRCSS